MSNDVAATLESAIANLTRLLARTDDPGTAAILVTGRTAMRRELEGAVRETADNVVPFDSRQPRGHR